MKVEFYKHSIDKDDIRSVGDILKTVFLTTGEAVRIFEDKFAGYLNSRYVIGVTSCTAALHLCLLAWGIGDGDEVITTPMSFCATANAILHAGATPVFADVEEETGNINAELIEARITKRTKAIIPVHLYGRMCDMKRIRQIAVRYNLIIIEDAAHCIEGMRDNIKVGQLGDAACFSFYATKNITSGEGGAISTNDSDKAELLSMLRLHGIDRSAADRYTKEYQHWDMPVLGWKYNMDNIQASILIGQLGRIDKLLARREEISRKYEDALNNIRSVILTKNIPGSTNARHLFTIRAPENRRDSMLVSLQEKGIGVAVNYRPIHLLKYYRERFGFKQGDFPVAEKIGAETLSLPLYPLLRDDEVNYVIKTVTELLIG